MACGPHLSSPGLGDSHPLSSEALLFCAPVAVSSPTAFFFFFFLCEGESLATFQTSGPPSFSFPFHSPKNNSSCPEAGCEFSLFKKTKILSLAVPGLASALESGFLLSLKACGIFSCSMRDRFPDQGPNPGPLCWERSLSQWPPGKPRARSLDNGFLSWDICTRDGWTQGPQRVGCKPTAPRACGLGDRQTEGEGLSQSRRLCPEPSGAPNRHW